MEASCSIVMSSADGDRVALDGAVVARWPGHLRLRAWKLHHAAFDVTATPEGVWLDAPEDERIQNRDSFARELREAWELVSGDFLQRELRIAERNASDHTITLIERTPAEPNEPICCTVDVRTLTPLRYEVGTPGGGARYVIDLTRYRRYGEIIWPRRISLHGRAGSMTINLHDAEFNGEPMPRAFTPPGRAVRQP